MTNPPIRLQTVNGDMGGFTVRYFPDGEIILNDSRVCEALERFLEDRILVLRKITTDSGKEIFQALAVYPDETAREFLNTEGSSWGNHPTSLVLALRYLLGQEFGGHDMVNVAADVDAPVDADNRVDPENVLYHAVSPDWPSVMGPACGDPYPNALTEGDEELVNCPRCKEILEGGRS